MIKPRQLLFYTRPWEVRFHIELARRFRVDYPNSRVLFVTFFQWAAKRATEAGETVVYMPDRLRDCVDHPTHGHRLFAIDEELNNRFDVGLNLMGQSERFLPKDGGEATNFIRRHAIVLDELVTEGTLSVSGMYDHFVYWLGGSLANARGGCHFAFVGSAVPRGTVLALRTPWEPWCSTIQDSPRPNLAEAKGQIESPNAKIEYMVIEPPRSMCHRLRGRVEYRLSARSDSRAGSYFANFSWQRFILSDTLFKLRITRKRPRYHINSEAELESWGSDRPFFYVPLHMEPEATILMYSPWLRDQLEMCRLLSQALPVGSTLLIKENPKMDGGRPLWYYDNLSRLPGVRLVSPQVSSLALMRGSNGVISLAGSACLEAALLRKPSLVLARPPFRSFFAKSDFAGPVGISLSQLSDWMRVPEMLDAKSLAECWQRWLGATFDASIVPRDCGGTIPELNPSVDNVSRYYRYIRNVLAVQMT